MLQAGAAHALTRYNERFQATVRILLCDGTTKSGSTLLFRILVHIYGHPSDPLNSLQAKPDVAQVVDGTYTGYIHDITRLIDLICSSNNASSESTDCLVVKVHNQDASCILSSGFDFTHFYTVRDPLDNILSLLEAGRKERDNAASGCFYRQEFASLEKPIDAYLFLYSQLKTLIDITESTANTPLVLLYPDYMMPSTPTFNSLAHKLCLDCDVLERVIVEVDYLSRRGDIWTELNVGIPGRGQGLMDSFEKALVADIYSLFNKLVKP